MFASTVAPSLIIKGVSLLSKKNLSRGIPYKFVGAEVGR